MENTSKENILYKRGTSEVLAECAAEYILPDYKGDVKRILHTEARALCSGSFADTAVTEFGGVAVFDVLYLDSENNLSSVSFSTDYSLKVPNKDGVCAVFAEPSTENVNVRLPGPRKMLARCTVKGSVKTECNIDLTAEGGTFCAENLPEVCRCDVKTLKGLRGTAEGREYCEQLLLVPGAALDDIEIVAKRADVKINSVTAKEDSVGVAGEIAISAIVRNADGAPYTKEMKIPFDEDVGLEGVCPDFEALARAEISSLECSVNPSDDGVRVNVSMILDMSVCAFGNTTAELLSDVFSPILEVENSYERVRYEELVGARRQSSRISREIPKNETDAECARDVVYMSTEARVNNVRLESSCVTVEGEVRFSGVACEIYEDGTPTYSSVKFSVPFSESVNFNTQIPSDSSTECTVSTFDARVTLDDESFYTECGICVSAALFAQKEAERLVSSEAVAPIESARGSNVISVYYPEDGDTLFGVAKKFKASPIKIAEDNALSAEAVTLKNQPSSLSSVGKLIIKSV